jgi:excisionase family DNA binding protein
MATAIVGQSDRARKGSYLTVGQAADRLNCHPSSIRYYVDNGTLQAVRLPSGHRRIPLSSILAFEGVDEDEGLQGNIVGEAAYCRVSGLNQNRSGSLTRQIDRLLTEVEKRTGTPRKGVSLFQDVASSFGDRPSLNRMVDGIIKGEIRRVWVEHFNRLSRVPSLTRLLEHLCKQYGVAICALDTEDEDEDSVSSDTRELIDFITVIANRQSARKAGFVTRKNIAPETIERMAELRAKNWDAARIHRQLLKEGHQTTKADGQKDDITYTKVLFWCDANGRQTMLSALATGEVKDAPQHLRDFLATMVEKDEGAPRFAVGRVYDAYRAFCEGRGVDAESGNVFGRRLKQAGIKVVKSNSRRVVCGIRLK